MLELMISVLQASAQIVTYGDFHAGDFTGWTLTGDSANAVVDYLLLWLFSE